MIDQKNGLIPTKLRRPRTASTPSGSDLFYDQMLTTPYHTSNFKHLKTNVFYTNKMNFFTARSSYCTEIDNIFYEVNYIVLKSHNCQEQ